MFYVKVCPLCANISWIKCSEKEREELKRQNDTSRIISEGYYYNQNICNCCGSNLINTDMLLEDYYKKIQFNIDDAIMNRKIGNLDSYLKINRSILINEIIPLQLIDKSLQCYSTNMLEFYGIKISVFKEDCIPCCPTCKSKKIRKISNLERFLNGITLGLLGNKRKCQFECLNPNCRYRW